LGDDLVGTERSGAAAEERQPVLYIVDDDALTVELVREVAEESGWVAYGFRRIAELRRHLGARRPQLLVLDDDLPDGRGGDLARELREDPALGDVPVVVCTAAHPKRQREIGGWAPVLSKPFDLYEFERHLRRLPRDAAGRRPQRASLGACAPSS
jgi:DNA-binding response OmpR family regulator